MLNRWKKLDPMTKTFVKVAVAQTAILSTVFVASSKLTTIEINLVPRSQS